MRKRNETVEDKSSKEMLLIRAVIDGDKNEFAAIVDRYKDMVYSILFRMVNEHEEANDLAQEVFIKVYRKLQQFKGDAKLSTWIYKIAYFEGLSYLRKHKRWNNSSYQVEVESEENMEKDWAVDALQEHVTECIYALKPMERTAITLFYLDELAVKEVADIMNITESYVKVTVHRAKKKLRQRIKKEYYEEARG